MKEKSLQTSQQYVFLQQELQEKQHILEETENKYQRDLQAKSLEIDSIKRELTTLNTIVTNKQQEIQKYQRELREEELQNSILSKQLNKTIKNSLLLMLNLNSIAP